jgi:hypothetical protein
MAPFDACGHSAGYTVIVQHRTPRAVRGGAKSITDSGAGLEPRRLRRRRPHVRDRELIGVDTLMWGSDYPHTESTFPQSHKILERILDGVPEGERQKIVRENAARLYGFEIG